MKNRILIALSFTLSFLQLYAQSTFEQLISKPEDQVINQVVEDEDGNFLMVGRIKNMATNRNAAYLLKLNETGKIKNEIIFDSNVNYSTMFFDVHYFNSKIYILGSKFVAYPDSTKLWYMQLDENLNIEQERTYEIPHGKWFSYMNSIIDSDTNLVITGYTTRTDDSNLNNHDAFFCKLSLDGDSLISRFPTSHNRLYLSFDITENTDSSLYYAFVSHFVSSSGGQKLILSRDFDSLSIDPIPLGMYDYYSPIHLNENDILLCAKGSSGDSEPYALNVISINDQTELIDYNYFKIEGSMRDHPALYKGVSKYNDNIFIGGNSNFDLTDPSFSSFNSWFHLIRINPDITPVWEYWYGGDAYYFLYSILATSDGGCLLVGSRYDDAVQYMERDIYVVKVNSDGLIVWTQEIPVDQQQMLVYPNPGTSYFAVQTRNQQLELELISLNGQVVIKQTLNSDANTVETERLPSGIYFYRLTNTRTHAIESGKWIKK